MAYLGNVAFADISNPSMESAEKFSGSMFSYKIPCSALTHLKAFISNPSGADDENVRYVRLRSDLNFITAPKVKEFISNICTRGAETNTSSSDAEHRFLAITNYLDEKLK